MLLVSVRTPDRLVEVHEVDVILCEFLDEWNNDFRFAVSEGAEAFIVTLGVLADCGTEFDFIT